MGYLCTIENKIYSFYLKRSNIIYINYCFYVGEAINF